MGNKIRPKYNKKMPKQAAEFFNPQSDRDFKKQHPVGYTILIVVGILVLVLPEAAYVIFMGLWAPRDSAWQLLGLAGAFLIGIALFNLVAAWIGQYLGHAVTLICLGAGTVLVALSVVLICHPDAPRWIDEDRVSYYFVNGLLLTLPGIYYLFFRFHVTDWLEDKKIRRREINKCKKGMRNFWWYEQLHKEYRMGWLYFLNKGFTLLYSAAFVLHLLLGWTGKTVIPFAVLFSLVCLLTAVMSVFSSVQGNKRTFGRIFVGIARTENGGIHCILFDIAEAAFPLLMTYAEWQHI